MNNKKSQIKFFLKSLTLMILLFLIIKIITTTFFSSYEEKIFPCEVSNLAIQDYTRKPLLSPEVWTQDKCSLVTYYGGPVHRLTEEGIRLKSLILTWIPIIISILLVYKFYLRKNLEALSSKP